MRYMVFPLMLVKISKNVRYPLMSQKDIGVQMIILGRAYSHIRLNIENYIYIYIYHEHPGGSMGTICE